MKVLFGKLLGLSKEDIRSMKYWDSNEKTFPSNVHTIGKKAFYQCFNLKSIKLPFGIKTVEDSVFESCELLHNVIFEDGILLTRIGNRAFYHCRKLINIELPLSLKVLGSSVFENCDHLQTVTFEEDSYLESIGDRAFKGCTYLTSIVIPKCVTKIGKNIFEDCPNVTIFCECEEKPDNWPNDWNNGRPVIWGCKRTIDGYYSLIYGEKDNKVYAYIDKFDNNQVTDFKAPETINGKECVIKGLNMSLFRENEVIKSVVLPSSVTFIQEDAFRDCRNLVSFEFEKGINIPSIGQAAFNRCYSLESIDIPPGVTLIECYAFNSCFSLNRVTIPDGVTFIDSGAFMECYSLITVTLPSSVIECGKTIGAFCDCYHLGEIVFASCEEVHVYDYRYVVPSKEETRLIFTDDGFVLHKYEGDITVIAYIGKEKDITIPNIATKIKDKAFYGYIDLKSITIPTSVTCIKDNPFEYTDFNDLQIKYQGTRDNWNRNVSKETTFENGKWTDKVICIDDEIKKEE